MKLFCLTVAFALASSAAFAADVKAGAADYNRACKNCHGADGTANPAIAKMMKVDIPDLKAAAVQGLSNAEIKDVITKGKGRMRPAASVTGAEVDNVIAYVRSLKK